MKYIENRHGKWELDEKLSPNFTLRELTIGALAMPTASHKYMIEEFTPEVYRELKNLAKYLQEIRDHFKCTMNINAGFRPHGWEILRGRTGKSQHVLGKAADFTVHCVTLKTCHDHCLKTYPDFGIAYSPKANFVHLDTCTSPKSRRWVY